MSLLMEAVKRAEESRRKDHQAKSSVSRPFRNANASNAASLTELSLLPTDPPPRPRADPPPFPPEILTAKRPSRDTRSIAWIAGVLLGVGIGTGIGIYYWLQLRSLDSPGRRPMAASAVTPSAPTLSPSVPAATPATPAAATPLTSAPARKRAHSDPNSASTLSGAPSLSPDKKSASSLSRISDLPRRSARTPDAMPHLERTFPHAERDSALEKAYAALQAGQDEEAQKAYEQVLAADGRNTDALLGLATLAARQGRTSYAQGYYLRALEADPLNATAQAGVFSTGGIPGDAESAESLLKTALAGQPGSTPLLFALGNLYARQQRWSEAQQAYFDAYASEPDNPDLIFNLAVSLDHLRQGRLAIQYYQMALDAARTKVAAFSPEEIRARIDLLSRTP